MVRRRNTRGPAEANAYCESRGCGIDCCPPPMNPLRLLLPGGLLAALVVPCAAAVELASPFSDHAVLQREVAVPVWGWDAAGTDVTVAFAGQTKQTRANASGGWRVDLDAMDA